MVCVVRSESSTYCVICGNPVWHLAKQLGTIMTKMLEDPICHARKQLDVVERTPHNYYLNERERERFDDRVTGNLLRISTRNYSGIALHTKFARLFSTLVSFHYFNKFNG